MNKLRKQASGSIARYVSAVVAGIVLCLLMYPASGEDKFGPDPASSSRELQLRYAQTKLKLAKLELQQAKKYNRALSQSVEDLVGLSEAEKGRVIASRRLSQATMERLHSNIKIAEERVEQAAQDSAGATESVLLAYAEEKLRLAELRLKLVQANHDRDSDVEIQKMNVDRARLKCELAQLQLDILNHPRSSNSEFEALSLVIDRLLEDYVALEQRVDTIEVRPSQLTNHGQRNLVWGSD